MDYEYWFNHRIALGLQNDLELTSYIVERDGDEILERDFALVMAVLFIYEIMDWMALFAGPGHEFEAHANFPVFRLGGAFLKKFTDGWDSGISLRYDIKEVNSFLAIGLTIGKRFGKAW